MKSLLTKVAKGIAFGDVSNSSVRNILTGISEKLYGKMKEQDIYDALEFFDYKCPYTGKDLRAAIENNLGGYATDHIVPQNREYCGLNVMGNLVIVDSEANTKKRDKGFEEFLRDRKYDDILGSSMAEREKRISKIKSFQKQYGYHPEKMRVVLSPLMQKRYDDLRKEQEKEIEKAVKITGLPAVRLNSKKSVVTKGVNQTQLMFDPSDETEFKKKLISRKAAFFELYYDTGEERKTEWKAKNFDANSNLRANIQSRPFWRNRKKEGLIKVVAKIK